MPARPYFAFRWREWLWALRWRLLAWCVIAVCLTVYGAFVGSRQMVIAGAAVVPALLAFALTAQGVLGLSYIGPERWPKVAAIGKRAWVGCWILIAALSLLTEPGLVTAIGLYIAGTMLLVLSELLLLPNPPPEKRPVLHHPMHQDKQQPRPQWIDPPPPDNPALGWIAIGIGVLIGAVLLWPF